MQLASPARTLILLAFGLCLASSGNAQEQSSSQFEVRTMPRSGGIAPRVSSLDGTFTITATTGTDISDAVSWALSQAKATCGTVMITPGTYTWGTSGVPMVPCETLVGNGVSINVNVGGAAPPPFLIVQGATPTAPLTNSTYTVGNIRGITFAGPSSPISQTSSTGIQLGGNTFTETAQLINLYDVHIRNFGCGLSVQFAFQIAVFGGSIEDNYDGVCFSNLVTFLENINFHGTQILNNIDYGINQNQTGMNTELELISCSVDYNGQNQSFGGQVQIANGRLNIVGGHFESNRVPMITIPVPGAAATASVFVTGAVFNLTDFKTSNTYTSFFSVKGVNDVLEVGRGVSFFSQGAAVSAVVDWEPTVNQNSRLLMDPYTYTVGNEAHGLIAYTGMTPNDYSYPTYDAHDTITGLTSSYSAPAVRFGGIQAWPVQPLHNPAKKAR